MSKYTKQKGFTPLVLLLVAAVGILSFLFLSRTADFQGGIFQSLFAKKTSLASESGLIFVDTNNQPVNQIISPAVRISVHAPWNPEKENTVSVLFAEDSSFTVNTKSIQLTNNPMVVEYSFSNKEPGIKNLYAKFSSSNGEVERINVSIMMTATSSND